MTSAPVILFAPRIATKMGGRWPAGRVVLRQDYRRTIRNASEATSYDSIITNSLRGRHSDRVTLRRARCGCCFVVVRGLPLHQLSLLATCRDGGVDAT